MAQNDDLKKLGDLLSDPMKRKAFFLDADEAMAEDGIDPGAIPPDLLGALNELDLGELDAVSRVAFILKWPV